MKNKITDKELSSFTKTMAEGFEDFKKEIEKKINDRTETNFKIIQPKNDFTFTNELIYLGGKDAEKEKQMASELGALMKKYKIVKCRAELFKNF